MQFLYPGFLYALLALLIPILIHLFYFRRFKKVYFSNVKFLKELKEETSNRNKLKNLLILLSRLLAFACLALAFAQPFLPNKDGLTEGASSVSIFIDNSFSMKALSADVPLFEKAKKKAREIIEAYAETDRFQILTHDFLPKHQRSLTKEDALSAIEEISVSPEVKSMSRILSRQNQVHHAANLEKKKSYILSDFQESIMDLNGDMDTTISTFFLPFQSVQENNVSIDSAWFSTPVPLLNQSNQLLIKITNHGKRLAENVRLSIKIDNQTKPFGLIDIEAGRSFTDTVAVTIQKPGVQEIELQITDYPIQFDDKYLMSFNVPSLIKVLEIHKGQGNKYLKALFGGLEYFALKSENLRNISYADLREYRMIILNDLESISSGLTTELKKYVQNGGNLLMFPDENANLDNVNTFLNTLGADRFNQRLDNEKEVKQLNTKEFVFDNVFTRIDKNVTLPICSNSFSLNNNSSKSGISLMQFRDDSDYIRKYNLQNGTLFLCVSSLDIKSNDLVQKAEVFVPLIYKASLNSGSRLKPSYTIGRDELIEIANRKTGQDLVYKIDGPTAFIPGQTAVGEKTILDINNMIKSEGIYQLNFDDEVLESFAFNFDRTESNLKYRSISDLKTAFEPDVTIYGEELEANFSEIIKQKEFGKYFWKWCLIGALLFLLIESLLIRYWRT